MTIQRTELFVPLTTAPAAGESREFRIQVIPEGEKGQFAALEGNDGRPRAFSAGGACPAPSDQSADSNAPAVGNFKSLSAKKNCEPQVLLQRDGERITSIRIKCSCGQVMDLACDYGDVGAVKEG